MKNDKIIKALDNINFGEQSKKRVLEKIKHKKSNGGKNIMSKKIIGVASVAAVLAICLLGSNILGIFNKPIANSFSIIAYASDGSKLGEINSSDEKSQFKIGIHRSYPLKDEKTKLVISEGISFEYLGDDVRGVEFQSDFGSIITVNRDDFRQEEDL